MEPGDETVEELYEGPVCLVCSSPIEEEFDYCPNCETPLSQSSTVDPMKAIRTEGQVLRRGANAPSTIVLIGMWAIFLPVFLLPLAGIVNYGPPMLPVLFVLLPAFLLYGGILYKVTSRYLNRDKSVPADEPLDSE